MTARGLATGLVLVSVLLTAARCGSPEELSTLRTALDEGPGVSDGLLHDAAAARSLSGLSTDDRALQHSLLSQTLLDQVAPAPDEPGEHKAWTDPVQEVVDRMIERRWNPPGPDRWGRFVAWQTYVTGIVQDADQLANALVADPSQTTLFLRPPVQRAAMAYARFCYPTPKTP
jgi:hypothetical protein